MEDKLLQRMKADRGWLAEQMAQVPVFRGYLENTTIWEADKMIRDEIARRLSEAKTPVNKAIKAAGEDVRAGAGLAALERLLNLVDKAANKVRFADYGHSAISAKVKIRQQDLARLLAYDRCMFEQLAEVEGAADVVLEMGPDRLEAALATFERQFDQRKKCLGEVAGGWSSPAAT